MKKTVAFCTLGCKVINMKQMPCGEALRPKDMK